MNDIRYINRYIKYTLLGVSSFPPRLWRVLIHSTLPLIAAPCIGVHPYYMKIY